MTQEIITYIIVLVAIVLALWKMYIKLSGRKKKKKEIKNKNTDTSIHNCSDCIAECSLRDAAPILIKENEELCETTVIKAKVPSTDE